MDEQESVNPKRRTRKRSTREKLREQLIDDHEAVAPSALPGVFRVTPKAADAYLTSADVAHLEAVARTMENAIVRQRVFAHLDERLHREERAAG